MTAEPLASIEISGSPDTFATDERGTSLAPLPLCVDLDGTLVKSDTLLDGLCVLARARPGSLALLPFWLARGKASLKREITARAPLDAAHPIEGFWMLLEVLRRHKFFHHFLLQRFSLEQSFFLGGFGESKEEMCRFPPLGEGFPRSGRWRKCATYLCRSFGAKLVAHFFCPQCLCKLRCFLASRSFL